MKKGNKLYKAVSALILSLCCVFLTGVISVRASGENAIGVKWWTMNQAHEGAEIARRLGGDNEAALAYFGQQWTTANNERKELEAQNRDYQGVWTITAYCNDGQSASGMPLYAYPRNDEYMPTVACNCLPFGTIIEIEGLGRFKVVDRGASSGAFAWHNSNWCDIYLWTEGDCYSWGVQHRNVWVVK